MKKYLLLPGYVTSVNDGQRHYISSTKLAFLYQVPMAECEAIVNMSYLSFRDAKRNEDLMSRSRSDLLQLRPRQDGDYSMPKLMQKSFYGCHNRKPLSVLTCQYTLSAQGQIDEKCLGCKERVSNSLTTKL